MHPARGFTLIELLIVVTLLSILLAVGFTIYSQVQVGVRDDKRKQDLRFVASALEAYLQRNNRYPCTNSNALNVGYSESQDGGFWIADQTGDSGCGTEALDQDYINNMPSDPRQNDNNFLSSSSLYGYGYWAGTLSGVGCPTRQGQYYVLFTRLENSNDPDRNGDPPRYRDCAGNNLSNDASLFFLTSKDAD